MRGYSHSYWLLIFVQPSADEGERANFREFLEKKPIFNEHPVYVYEGKETLKAFKVKCKLNRLIDSLSFCYSGTKSYIMQTTILMQKF